jgi:SAM-dependent methyltransferase
MEEMMFADSLPENIRRFTHEALPLSHWGERYFDIRLMELKLADSLFSGVISRGGERALDIGCGIGLAAVYLSEYFSSVDGTDIDEIGVAFHVDRPAPIVGAEILSRLKLKTVQLHCGDSFEFLDARSECYDFIFSSFVLEHVPDVEKMIFCAAGALRRGGRMFHIVPNTHDTIIQLLLRNLEPVRQNIRKAISVRRQPGRVDGKLMGSLFSPITHSEFIDDYRQQFDINSLEYYLFPMLMAGLNIIDIKPMREHSFGILAEKPTID